MTKLLSNIKTYQGGVSYIPGKRNVIKLSSNESPFGPSKKVLLKIKSMTKNINRYPSSDCSDLKKKIGKRYKLPVNNIFCGNGSDEILGLACQLFLEKGDEVIIPKNSFLMYEIYSKINSAKIIFSSTKDYVVSVKDVIKKINRKTKIIFIAHPNNPTGLFLSKQEINRLVSKIPKKVILIIDAAYAEFIKDNSYDNGISLFKKNKNIIVTRTFSKIYGLASLRLGWCIAAKEIIYMMDKIRGPFNVNQVAQAAGCEAIMDIAYEKKIIKHNLKWLEKIKTELKNLPIKIYDGKANFLFMNVGKDNKDKLNKFLLSKSIIVRTLENYNINDCIRVSIGTSIENIKFIKLMKIFFKNA
tara:strand:- start:2754 stop:3824 length:1071 start_codon:yes stop_codon:yes gene_type:complete